MGFCFPLLTTGTMMKLYGIPNCNTVKKARDWLSTRQIDLPFHDFKKQGIDSSLLQQWLAQVGRDRLINRQGTTWRQLPDEVKAGVVNDTAAIQLMLDKPSVIKRPVLDIDGRITLGFDQSTYETLFDK